MIIFTLLNLQYLILVFGAACGVLQAVFAFRRIEGLRFFHNAAVSYLFSAVVSGGFFVWFYASDDRNKLPVVEGVQQSVLFLLGAGAAVVFTTLVSSVVNSGMQAFAPPTDNPGAKDSGLESLKRMTYFQYLLGRAKVQRKAAGR